MLGTGAAIGYAVLMRRVPTAEPVENPTDEPAGAQPPAAPTRPEEVGTV